MSLTLFQNLQLTDSVDWVNDHPPIAEPPCGFRGEKCISEFNNSYLRCFVCREKHFPLIIILTTQQLLAVYHVN
jgi:hypothetical protein